MLLLIGFYKDDKKITEGLFEKFRKNCIIFVIVKPNQQHT